METTLKQNNTLKLVEGTLLDFPFLQAFPWHSQLISSRSLVISPARVVKWHAWVRVVWIFCEFRFFFVIFMMPIFCIWFFFRIVMWHSDFMCGGGGSHCSSRTFRLYRWRTSRWRWSVAVESKKKKHVSKISQLLRKSSVEKEKIKLHTQHTFGFTHYGGSFKNVKIDFESIWKEKV